MEHKKRTPWTASLERRLIVLRAGFRGFGAYSLGFRDFRVLGSRVEGSIPEHGSDVFSRIGPDFESEGSPKPPNLND